MYCNRIESGVQLFSRVNRKSILEDINPALFPEGGPYPNQVIEITGDPLINKNDLIIDFIVRCILPNSYNKEWKGSSAILINTEFQISILKIIKVIEFHMIKHNITHSKKSIIENALKNLIIFNCYNLEQLEITFHYLEKIVQCNENINLVIIDNIASYFWTSSLSLNTPSYYHHSLKMFEALHSALSGLHVLLIFARHEKNTNKKQFNNKIDFRIEVEKAGENYKAIVMNYEKGNIVHVPFQLKTVLEFK